MTQGNDILYFMKKHADTAIILGCIFASVNFMKDQFKDIEKKMTSIETEMTSIKTDIAVMKTEMAVIKTVLLMKNILPSELVKDD